MRNIIVFLVFLILLFSVCSTASARTPAFYGMKITDINRIGDFEKDYKITRFKDGRVKIFANAPYMRNHVSAKGYIKPLTITIRITNNSNYPIPTNYFIDKFTLLTVQGKIYILEKKSISSYPNKEYINPGNSIRFKLKTPYSNFKKNDIRMIACEFGLIDKTVVVLKPVPDDEPLVLGNQAEQTTKLKYDTTSLRDRMVMVKGGCFQMGDIFGDGRKNEKPVHEVCLDDFYMGKYEVMQGEWEYVMGNNPSKFKKCGKNCPVEKVYWNDVKEFIKTLNQKTGLHYRLPTEAEWEFAARSGGKREKWAGGNSETTLENYAWYSHHNVFTTSPVGQKISNGLGLKDMSGNYNTPQNLDS